MKERYIKAGAERIQMEVKLENQATRKNNSKRLTKTFRNQISSFKIKGENLFIFGSYIYDDPCSIADLFNEHCQFTYH